LCLNEQNIVVPTNGTIECRKLRRRKIRAISSTLKVVRLFV
jgi:hypothetical protein